MTCRYIREATLYYILSPLLNEINYAKDPLKYFNLLNNRYCILGCLLQTLSHFFHEKLNSKLRTVSKCRKRKKGSLC